MKNTQKALHLEAISIYQKTEHQFTFVEGFFLPFGGKLNKENRGACLTKIIPWWKAEGKCAQSFKKKIKGERAYFVRIALGTLYIKERLELTDRETVEQTTENPYLQYFIGLPEFQKKAPFHHFDASFQEMPWRKYH